MGGMRPAFEAMRRVDLFRDCLEESMTLGQLQRVDLPPEEGYLPIVQHVRKDWQDEGVNATLKGSISYSNLTKLLYMYREKAEDYRIDLLNPDLTRSSGGGSK